MKPSATSITFNRPHPSGHTFYLFIQEEERQPSFPEHARLSDAELAVAMWQLRKRGGFRSIAEQVHVSPEYVRLVFWRKRRSAAVSRALDAAIRRIHKEAA